MQNLSLTGSGQRGALSVVNITFSLPEHRAVLQICKLQMPGATQGCKDISTSAIPL